MDRNWHYRDRMYKICVVTILCAFGPFMVGISNPYWLQFSQKRGNGYDESLSVGLWESCVSGRCSNNPAAEASVIVGHSVIGDWILSVMVLQVLALPIAGLSIIAMCFQNFAPRRWLHRIHFQRFRRALHRDSEVPEDLAFLSGFFNFHGIIIFMIMTSEAVSHGAFYSWGFAMAFVSASLQVVFGLLMCKSHFLAAPRPQQELVQTLLANSNSRTSERQTQR